MAALWSVHMQEQIGLLVHDCTMGNKQVYRQTGLALPHRFNILAMGNEQAYMQTGLALPHTFSIFLLGNKEVYMQTGWALLCTIQCLQSTMGDNADIPTVIQTAMVLLIADDHHDDQPADNGTPTPSPPPPPSDAHSGSDTGSQDGAAHVQGSDQGGDDNVKPRDKVYADDMIASLVDTVLMSYDKNNDGYVEYFEYKTNKVLEEVHG